MPSTSLFSELKKGDDDNKLEEKMDSILLAHIQKEQAPPN